MNIYNEDDYEHNNEYYDNQPKVDNPRENTEENSFRHGLLFGAIFSLAIFAVLLIVLSITGNLTFKKPSKVAEGEISLDYNAVNEKLQKLLKKIDSDFLFEADVEMLENHIYKGLMAGLDDPYSVYYTAEEYADMNQSTNGNYVGIGVSVTQDPSTMEIVIASVFDDSPAKESGFMMDDIIVAVGELDVTGMDMSEVVTYIKGEEGTKVVVKVYRPSIKDYVEMTVERRKVEMTTVSHKMLEDDIGYILITEFAGVTPAQFNKAIEALEKEGAKALILDVRSNPGGLLTSVVSMLDKILPEGRLVSTETKKGKESEYFSDEKCIGLPIAVLINGYSASASEIFAGAIKDYEWGTIIGVTTYGKGIVQNIIPFKDGSAIKLTISNYFTPKGESIHKVGVSPDIEVKLNAQPNAKEPYNGDNQLQKAVEVLQEKLQ